MDAQTLVIIIGATTNLLAIGGIWIKIERRITRIETLVNILIRNEGIRVRSTNHDEHGAHVGLGVG